jgi:hypothetical protein
MSTILTSDDFRQELHVLTRRVEALERRFGQNGNTAPVDMPFEVAGIMAEVRSIAQELFPGKCEFTTECDPEYPDDRYVVVNVEANGSPKEIVDRELVWDQRIRQLWPHLWDKLVLSVVPR